MAGLRKFSLMIRTSRTILRLAALALAVPLALSTAIDARGDAARPTVVELFTSQGCSSCPPADAHLGELAARPDILALAFHIDYWDYIGWKDPFASKHFTGRQYGYARSLGKRGVYTPQMVIDGRHDAVGSRPGEVRAGLDKAAQDAAAVPVRLARDADGLAIAVDAGAGTACDIWVVAYDDRHTTEIKRGENEGRSLTEYNIVRDIWLAGEWTGEPWSGRVDPARLARMGLDPDRVAVLVQAKGQGPIMGAASTRMK